MKTIQKLMLLYNVLKMLEKKREQKIDINIKEKLMNKNDAKLEKKIADIPQEMDRTYSKLLQKHVREDHCEECE